MTRIQVFRQQQEDILNLVERISSKLDEGPLTTQIDEILFLLSALRDKIAIHLVGEDDVLNFSMIRGRPEEISAQARLHRKEISFLARRIANFANRWEDREMILCQPRRFLREAGGVFAVLDHCIQHEQQRFFPLMETAHA